MPTIIKFIVMFLIMQSLAIGCKPATVETKSEKKQLVVITPMSHPSLEQCIRGLRTALQDQGYLPDRLLIEQMNANSDFSAITSLVKMAIAKKPDAIFVLTTPASSQAILLTNEAKIPLVYAAVTDPVGAKIVTDMERSETLATGVSDRYPVEEQVRFFTVIRPGLATAGIIYSPNEQNSLVLVNQTKEALVQRKIISHDYKIYNASEIASQTKRALAENDCLIVNGDNLATDNIATIVNLCIQEKKPLFVGDPDSVRRGGVATVGPSYLHIGYLAGRKVAKILQGTNPSEIPSEYPRKFDYIVNVESALKMNVSLNSSIWGERSIWESRDEANGH